MVIGNNELIKSQTEKNEISSDNSAILESETNVPMELSLIKFMEKPKKDKFVSKWVNGNLVLESQMKFPIRKYLPHVENKALFKCLYKISITQEEIIRKLLKRMRTLTMKNVITINSARKLVNNFILLCNLWMNVPLNANFQALETTFDNNLDIIMQSDYEEVLYISKRDINRFDNISGYLVEDLDFVKLEEINMVDLISTIIHNQDVIMHNKNFETYYPMEQSFWILLEDIETKIEKKIYLFYQDWLNMLCNSKLKKLLDISLISNLRKITTLSEREVDSCVERSTSIICDGDGAFNDFEYISVNCVDEFTFKTFQNIMRYVKFNNIHY
jgi:hypothetical protein